MPFPELISFLLWFFLFASCSALTYLSARSWMRHMLGKKFAGQWRQTHWHHVGRMAAFGLLTIAALLGALNGDFGRRGLDLSSLIRITADLLLFLSTPRILRRRPLVGVGFGFLVAGEALVLANYRHLLPDSYYPMADIVLVLCATVFTDAGIAILWQQYTRTILRVKLTDKFALTFSVYSVFLLLFVTLSIVEVVQSGLTDQDSAIAFASLNHTLVTLFLSIVTLSAILSFFMARSLTEPVARMSSALRDIGRGHWNKPITGIKTRDEIRDLAHEINMMAVRLKEADELRAEYVSFASHELRNPLTAVKGFIETLRFMDADENSTLSPQERSEIYEIVSEECERLLRMTNELLDTHRIEAGKPITLRLQMCDIYHLAQKVVRVMATHTKNHTLRVTECASSVMLQVDPDKIEQVMINLLSNAIKYSPNGGEIIVSIADRDRTVDIDVCDQGMGMTEEQIERVFDKFYRIQDGARDGDRPKGMASGSGIGLYLTRSLVYAHSGNIRVQSAAGSGSTFTVTLPKRVKNSPVIAGEISTVHIVPEVPAGLE